MLNNSNVTISSATTTTEVKAVTVPSANEAMKRANELVKAREKFETETLASFH